MWVPEKVVVHPLTLLSIVDHYSRAAKDTRKRVVGVLLGERHKGRVDITNSYAVPFEEEDSSIWFLDHSYHENMYAMCKKINAKEVVVGWYSTGPKIRETDLEINEVFRNYCTTPILVVIDVTPKAVPSIPTKAYYAIEEVKENATEKAQKTFAHVSSEVGAYEAEEIGVEHLLRDVKDSTISTLATEVTAKMQSLRGLLSRLRDMRGYLELVVAGTLPINRDIMHQLQEVFNLLPNLEHEAIVKAFAVKTNDMMLVIYIASLIRSTIALHNLINNKVHNKEAEKRADAQSSQAEKEAKEKKEDKDKVAKDKEKDKDKAKEASAEPMDTSTSNGKKGAK
eukprot:jgi/Mesvir1/1186/Mv17680-RA.1